jgi:hypothetical protein
MCEILFLTFLTVKIGNLAEDRGYSALLFRVVFVSVWLAAEGLGWYAASVRFSAEEYGIMRIWVVGFLAALAISGTLFLAALLLPNQTANQRTGAFGDYRDDLEAMRQADRRKRSRRRRRRSDDDEEDRPAPSFDA